MTTLINSSKYGSILLHLGYTEKLGSFNYWVGVRYLCDFFYNLNLNCPIEKRELSHI